MFLLLSLPIDTEVLVHIVNDTTKRKTCSSVIRVQTMKNTSVADTSLENATGLSMAVPSKTEGIAWCSALILLSVFIVVGNLLTIVLFARNKTLRKRSLFLVINMAFADLILGALALPF